MDVYSFHHSIDFLILRATEKILKTKSLAIPRQHFYSDFSNDIGIINLLRQTYLRNGDIKETFDLYQNSRLEPKSYRYESLLALLIITIVGNVISGILVETYFTHKSKLKKIFDEKTISAVPSINEQLQEQFLRGRKNLAKEDFQKVLSCYIARLMLDRQMIELNSYYTLVNHFMYANSIEDQLKSAYNQFENEYKLEIDSIDTDKIFNIVEGYSRGVYLKYLDEQGCEILYFEDINSANNIKGIPISPGFVKGKILKVNEEHLDFTRENSEKIVLCYGGNFSPDKIKVVYEIDGVVTWNTGMTGHLPLICRSLKIPCVIISPSDSKLLLNNDNIILSGGEGLIYTGLFVKQ
jgi:phosphohistidine swiveling domain-containing protein